MKKFLTLAGLIVAGLTVTSIQSVAEENQICACVGKVTGRTRMIAEQRKCRRRETRICWNATGPQGPTGNPGLCSCEISGEEYDALVARVEALEAGFACADNDGDGFSALSCGGTDCDDSVDSVFPGATELCDGIDNNCDGESDEGCIPQDVPHLVINEIDYDQEGTDLLEFIEIFNPTDSDVNLAEYKVELFNGGVNPAGLYRSFDLASAGSVLPAGGYLIIHSSSLALPADTSALAIDMLSDMNNIQNGSPDGVRISDSAGATVDSLSYEGEITAAATSQPGIFPLTEGSATNVFDSGSGTICRCPDGADNDDNSTDFVLCDVPTPGMSNDCL
ncbi:MAG: lamin tail domain-containing protein [Deltaproteobacteria bacterium]|nr:MAG: lamin tail domain-containing protein [Deltaproteobacteria bacterium]